MTKIRETTIQTFKFLQVQWQKSKKKLKKTGQSQEESSQKIKTTRIKWCRRKKMTAKKKYEKEYGVENI